MITDHTAPPEGGVYNATARELLTVASHLLRWSTRMTRLTRQGGATPQEEREYRLHRAAMADHMALTTGSAADADEAGFTAVALLAADDKELTPSQAGYVPRPREYVRTAYGRWLAEHPDRDALAPGDWL